ncbi:hydrogen gas-evolving membrane-bound hydrogenase subunit E [Haloarchaeobius amylolyticus]|uniref:hydrogen gas-evolving membrane-bound hydrogenase subunit E n=1 Tax=Haloarchaeobius amylolyticus TaxID=1198296 RepID=UPI00227203A4|nr:hydrogen gas-evolving membrane-bound hydrogenase subunit E [Haloarchaeobius amylolyticus]
MTPDLAVLLALVGLPFLGAAAVPVVYRGLGERTAYFAAAVALVCLGLVSQLYGTHGAAGVEWIPTLDVSLRFYVDGLSLLIATLATGVGVAILTYSGGYMHGEPGQPKYYATLLAFMGSMLGVALAADLITLFLFWELTSLTSFLLIGHYTDQDSSQYAARKSMLITVAGGLFMLVGFVILHTVSADALGQATWALFGGENAMLGSAENAEAMRAAMEEQGVFWLVLALVGVGAAAKSAQVPLHIWLPNAMEAPTPVSAFLHSATMVKAGVYLVGRVRPLFLPEGAHPGSLELWTLAFASLGLLTMTVTAILAVSATDIKELLAYSTASHLGLIVAGFGFAGHLGAETGAFHILNHALFKATLFLVAGIIAHEAGTRKIAELGGLREDLPVTAVIAAVAALGMAGVPPFNGFYSKEFLFHAAWETGAASGGIYWLIPAVAVFGSVFTFLYSIRFLMLFFGEKPDELGHVHSPPLPMLAPPAVLATLAGVVGVVGITSTFGVHLGPLNHFVGEVIHAVEPVGAEGEAFSYYLPTSPKPWAGMSALTIVLGVAAYPQYDRLHDGIRSLLRGPVRANWWYDNGTEALNPGSDRLRGLVQNGLLRTYATWTVAAFATLTILGYVTAGVSPDLPTSLGSALPLVLVGTVLVVTAVLFSNASLETATGVAGVLVAAVVAVFAWAVLLQDVSLTTSVPVVLVLSLAVVAALAVSRAPSHIAGVLTLSILGFMVAIFFILANAPDLALTQLVVETLVLVIFLLVLDKLPAFYGRWDRMRVLRDGALSLVVGATVFVTVLLTTADKPDTIATTLAAASYPEAGGTNIVNVILVDFRAFDTMGEIAVVAMAALSVVTLVALRERGGTE